jgi:flagellar biosynthesis protein FliR
MTDWQWDAQTLLIHWAHVIALVFVRVSAMVSVLPGVGSQGISVRVRLAAAIALTMIVFPTVEIALALETVWEFLALSSAELIVGLALGIGLRLIAMTLQIAGSMAAQATSLSQILGSAGADPMPAIGHVLVVGGIAIAVTLGLHTHVARMLVTSYDFLPVGSLPAVSDLSRWGLAQTARAFDLAFALAAPFVIVSMLYNLMLGVINRAMPQLMVAFIGAPLITLGGLLILLLAAPLILQIWSDALFGFGGLPAGVNR